MTKQVAYGTALIVVVLTIVFFSMLFFLGFMDHWSVFRRVIFFLFYAIFEFATIAGIILLSGYVKDQNKNVP